MCMGSHPVGLDVWFLVGPFVYSHTLCVQTAKAVARLHGCAGSPEPSLVACMISTIISCAGSFGISHKVHHMTKPTKWSCAQQRLRSARASTQSDQSWLCAQQVAKDPPFLHSDSEESDQTGWMPRLIWVYPGCTCHSVGVVMRWLRCTEKIWNIWTPGKFL